jgi:hypothetical protein
MRRGPGAENGRIEGLPGATGAQHKEDGIHADPVWRARLAAAEAVRIYMPGKKPFDLRPQVIRNAPSLGAFEVLSLHPSISLKSASCTENNSSCIQEL